VHLSNSVWIGNIQSYCLFYSWVINRSYTLFIHNLIIQRINVKTYGTVVPLSVFLTLHFTIRTKFKSKFLNHLLISFGVRYTVCFLMPNLSTIFAVKILSGTSQESSLHPQLSKWDISVFNCISIGCHYSHFRPFFVHKKSNYFRMTKKTICFEVFTAVVVKILGCDTV
jgi:hypothetical protein